MLKAIIVTNESLLATRFEQENTEYAAEHTVSDLKDLEKASTFLKPDLLIVADDFSKEKAELYHKLISLKDTNQDLKILLYMKEFKFTDNQNKIQNVGELVEHKIFPKFKSTLTQKDVLADLKTLDVKDQFLQEVFARYLDLKALKQVEAKAKALPKNKVKTIQFLGDPVILANLAKVITKQHKSVALIANADNEIFALLNASLENKDEAMKERGMRAAILQQFNDISLGAFDKTENKLKVADKFLKDFDYCFIVDDKKEAFDYVDKTIFAGSYSPETLTQILQFIAKDMKPDLALISNIPHRVDISSSELLLGYGIDNFIAIRKVLGNLAINNRFNGILDVDTKPANQFVQDFTEDLTNAYTRIIN